MPNHVTNEIFLEGPKERIEAFLERAKVSHPAGPSLLDEGAEEKTVEREFSFRAFVPPPDHPDYTSGGCSHRHPFPGMADYVKSMFGVDMDPNHPMLVAAQQPEEHPNCWYVWNNKHWGTKWDAYDVEIKVKELKGQTPDDDGKNVECRIQFDTAWSPPGPVFEKILEDYRDILRGLRWMDEDMQGSGGGYIKLMNGEVVESKSNINDPDGPDGALWWWLASQLKGYTKERHQEYLDEIAEEERQASLN